MGIQKDTSGRRWVQVEIEVPGTPEQVWEAIATGPGVSSWFMPTQVITDESGIPKEVRLDFGPGMEAVSRVTEWDPPRKYSADSDDMGEGAPTVATEWIVEAWSGGVCVVRVVHSLFSSGDDWDSQLESVEGGWPWFFQVLRLYLTHFVGQKCAMFRVMGSSTRTESEAWNDFTGSLGIGKAVMGERLRTSASAPQMEGAVVRAEEHEDSHGLMVHLTKPGPGIASLFAMPMGETVLLVADIYFYGDSAVTLAGQEEDSWKNWMTALFPSASPPQG